MTSPATTTTTPTPVHTVTVAPDLDGDWRDLWAEATRLQAEILERTARLEVLKQKVRDHLAAGTYGNDESGAIVVSNPKRSFSEDAARALIPTSLLPAVQTTIVDPKKIKAASEELYDRCLVPGNGKPSVSFK